MRGELIAYTWHALRGTQEEVSKLSKSKNNSQRALVFQGGGPFGAYEAGTFQQIYKKVNQENENGKLFDIIAGTSIGAINSTVLVGHYMKNNNSWKGSTEKILQFWEGLCSLQLQMTCSTTTNFSVTMGLFAHNQS